MFSIYYYESKIKMKVKHTKVGFTQLEPKRGSSNLRVRRPRKRRVWRGTVGKGRLAREGSRLSQCVAETEVRKVGGGSR